MTMAASSACNSTGCTHRVEELHHGPPQCMQHAEPLRARGLHKALVLKWVSSRHSKTHKVKCGAKPFVAAAADLYANRRPSPLTRGGTLMGDKAAGKDPGLAVLGKAPPGSSTSYSGPFQDARWKHGTWDLSKFPSPIGNVDWDAVIDAEVLRRKCLEENPEASLNEDPVVFQMSAIPWWAWVRRFHLPEAELVNGRAAMVGFVMGYLVDGLTGMGLLDQTNTFIGKLLLLISVLGIMFIRKTEDIEKLKQLAQEWKLYDKQWQASWRDEQVPSSEEN